MGVALITLNTEWLQRALFHRSPWMRGLAIAAVCLALGIPVGAVIGSLGALLGSGLLCAIVIAAIMLRSVMVGLVMLCGVICVLPFAVIPIDIGFTPTFLDVILLGYFLFGSAASSPIVRRSSSPPRPPCW
jgi:hypothetical protein